MDIFNRDAVKAAIKPVVTLVASVEKQHTDQMLTKNTLDCFGALLDSATQQISIAEWKKQEKSRQVQKTKQNAIGDMHEIILATLDGVERLPVGNIYDIRCDRLKVIAEVKNKWNTTKGNHKIQIYHDLAKGLMSKRGYIAYYVEILPKNGKSYNEPFVPSDNRTSSAVVPRNDIRKIDGRSFYKLITGDATALDKLYLMLPSILGEILSEFDGAIYNKAAIENAITGSKEFKNIYNKIYKAGI